MPQIQQKFHKRAADYIDASMNHMLNNATGEVSVWFKDDDNRVLWIRLTREEAHRLGNDLLKYTIKDK